MVEVPRVVTIDRCALEASMLPDVAPMGETIVCAQTWGKGSVCFGPADAWRLEALIAALKETWLAVKACEAKEPS